jgi:hypothetical protein
MVQNSTRQQNLWHTRYTWSSPGWGFTKLLVNFHSDSFYDWDLYILKLDFLQKANYEIILQSALKTIRLTKKVIEKTWNLLNIHNFLLELFFNFLIFCEVFFIRYLKLKLTRKWGLGGLACRFEMPRAPRLRPLQSISSTFYARVFHTKVLRAATALLHFGF